ncbi:MAG: asparagine synthase (glutamine-hydrolyzing) [Rhodocyclaceae bacterium]|nr:asparagine synthase (glutamine-hydrolyzing) [Rhodocyclaceae bacterium]MBX3669575.1 asparagine synthase (glutamine-hydrolyzing) [Rhodocyclaceae bacterium]
MCGIFGLLYTPWRQQAEKALARLDPRGPDERELLDLGDVLFGHTRLAVIDPAGGHQPMRTQDERYSLVFNGEIYNFRALRAELEQLGHSFLTRSDTEVLLHAFAQWGEALPPRLDGMFAYAVWDAQEQRLYAARDRLGIKPFFYSTARGFAFASTLAPFRALDGFPRDLDWRALRDYLAYQTCLAPHSFFAAVAQLPPACRLRWAPGDARAEVERYWNISPPGANAPAQEELVEQVDAAITAAVRAQLVADVPLGAFLSGGVDSSLMVRYMAEAGARPLRTFSMRFAEQGFDESAHALDVARRFGCEHHVLDAPSIDADAFARTVADLDQPLADPAYVMTHALSGLTRQHVTVAISGDGGDELFAGYARYRVQQQDFPRRPGQALMRALVLRRLLPGSLLRRALWGEERMLYRQVEAGPWPVSRKSLSALLQPEVAAAADLPGTLALWRELARSFGGTLDTASLMRADLWTYLSENCLVKTDRASMAHGLEVRVPLLGNAVLDTVIGLPAQVHFDAGGGKALLRALARRHLPECVWNRPKHGFSVPLRALFSGPWQGLGDELFASCPTHAPYLDAAAAQGIWRAARGGQGNLRLAYSLLVLLLWERHDRAN